AQSHCGSADCSVSAKPSADACGAWHVERVSSGKPCLGTLPRCGDIPWLRRAYRVGRGDAMTPVGPMAIPVSRKRRHLRLVEVRLKRGWRKPRLLGDWL